jgi:hypothetical protein
MMLSSHHARECTMGRDSPQPADAWQDYFCACHLFAEPLRLTNGNVAWPSGWTRGQARTWRRLHDLIAPPATTIVSSAKTARKRTESRGAG